MNTHTPEEMSGFLLLHYFVGVIFFKTLDSLLLLSSDQRLDLCRLNASDSDAVRGQIVGKAGHSGPHNHFLHIAFPSFHIVELGRGFFPVSLQTRDRIGSGGPVVDCRGLLENDR